MTSWFWIIPFLPLAGFLVNGLLGPRLSPRAVGTIACATVGAAFAVSVGAVWGLAGSAEHEAHAVLATWIPSGMEGGLEVAWGFLLDPLSAVMILVVTGVGFLIHVYSVGYMHGDPGYARYFAYLNLFTAMMLTLVLGSSFPVLFVGWEGVGLCSYLLIGFWYEDLEKARAGMKAFLVNRIGDFGFLIGMLLIFVHFGTLEIREVAEAAPGAGAALTVIALLLFVGATGKSAQIPLYTWLPDAMAGPTPVSALIHAATMVTAGVYMVSRASGIYLLAPAALATVAVIGACTAVFAASIALVQNDIKKVLAYSTVSQLGYMFLACGVGAFSAAIFHLTTHAFFKALLFLGAGSVIHGLSGEQDMSRMGGLKAKMPSTYRTMLVGAAALAGIPPLAGFFSKDEILARAWGDGHKILWALGSLAAAMTAFYTFRLIYRTFHGEPGEATGHAHESPSVMTVPLWILAALAAVGGLALGVPHVNMRLEHWLEPAFEGAPHALPPLGMEIGLMALATVIAVAGWFFGARLARRVWKGPIFRVLWNKYWVDELYDLLFVRPILGSSRLLDGFDRQVVDGTVNGSGAGVEITGQVVKLFQTGYVRNYALSFLLGVIFILWFLLVR